MSLDKAIKYGKEHREPYRGSKAIDATCRNHGGCPWCEENRRHKFRDKHPMEPEDDTMYEESSGRFDYFPEKYGNNEQPAERYRYYCLMRPFGPGAVPAGVCDWGECDPEKTIPEIGRGAWGWVEYDRELTMVEIAEYELAPAEG